MPDDAVRNLIRTGKVEQIYSVMQTSTSRGMLTMEQSLSELVQKGTVSAEMAISLARRVLTSSSALLERGSGWTYTPSGPADAPSPFTDESAPPRVACGSQVRSRHGDLNKEIKLSELFKRPKKQKGPRTAKPAAKPKRAKKEELVGLKVGASQIAASRVMNDHGARLLQLARTPLPPGSTAMRATHVERLALPYEPKI